MTRTRFISWTALAISAVVVIGCGGGSDATSTEATAVTRADYKQAVEARCADYQTERDAAQKPLQETFKGAPDLSQISPQDLEAASDQLAALNDTTRQVLTDLVALPRPEADSATLDQAYSTVDDAQAALDEVDQAAADGDGAGVDAAYKKLDAALNNNKAVAEEFGLSSCG
jgi:hypothetical protein